MDQINRLSRRKFLKISGITGTVLVLGYSSGVGFAPSVKRYEFDGLDATGLNDFIFIDQNGKITLINHRPEMGQGVKTDSDPIPWDPESRYRFSAWAKSTGPNCRILLQGYKWKPKVKPHDNPKLSDLRRCYRFKQLFFGIVKAGEMGGVKGAWDQASRTIPECMPIALIATVNGVVGIRAFSCC